MTTAGGNVRWSAAAVAGADADALARVEAEAAAARQLQRLLYLPYLQGERCPVDDPHARACFVGMGAGTNRSAMCRAVLEGICFAVRSLLPLLPEEPAAFVAHDDAVAELQAQIATAEALRRQGPVGPARCAARFLSFGEGDAAVDEAPPPLVLVGGVANSRVLAAASRRCSSEVGAARPGARPGVGRRRARRRHRRRGERGRGRRRRRGRGGGGGGVLCAGSGPRAVYDDAYERWRGVHPALSETLARAARSEKVQ